MTTANDNAFRRCSRQPRPARLPSRSQLRAPCADSWNSMAVDGARFVEHTGPAAECDARALPLTSLDLAAYLLAPLPAPGAHLTRGLAVSPGGARRRRPPHEPKGQGAHRPRHETSSRPPCPALRPPRRGDTVMTAQALPPRARHDVCTRRIAAVPAAVSTHC